MAIETSNPTQVYNPPYAFLPSTHFGEGFPLSEDGISRVLFLAISPGGVPDYLICEETLTKLWNDGLIEVQTSFVSLEVIHYVYKTSEKGARVFCSKTSL